MLLETVNSAMDGDAVAAKIAPRLAEAGQYIASASTVYGGVLRDEVLLAHRDRATVPVHHPRPVQGGSCCTRVTTAQGRARGRRSARSRASALFGPFRRIR